jgi:hypothetical protein
MDQLINLPETKNIVILPSVMDLLKDVLSRQGKTLKQITDINTKAEALNGTGHSE